MIHVKKLALMAKQCGNAEKTLQPNELMMFRTKLRSICFTMQHCFNFLNGLAGVACL